MKDVLQMPEHGIKMQGGRGGGGVKKMENDFTDKYHISIFKK
jgi:hypothetical protein